MLTQQGLESGWARLQGIVNVLTGARLQQATIFSLGVMPCISASILFSLLTKVVPALEKLSKEGPSGHRKISQYAVGDRADLPAAVVLRDLRHPDAGREAAAASCTPTSPTGGSPTACW